MLLFHLCLIIDNQDKSRKTRIGSKNQDNFILTRKLLKDVGVFVRLMNLN